jgi:hypothetical protein
METLLTWKTKLFSTKYELYRQTTLEGVLNKMNWSKKVTGEINGREILFETKGFFKQETHITDLRDNSSLGSITHNSWKSKALIRYQDKVYNWQFDNFWRSKWSIRNRNGTLIRYQSHAFTGTITSYTDDEILIITGFFIRNLAKKRSNQTGS